MKFFKRKQKSVKPKEEKPKRVNVCKYCQSTNLFTNVTSPSYDFANEFPIPCRDCGRVTILEGKD